MHACTSVAGVLGLCAQVPLLAVLSAVLCLLLAAQRTSGLEKVVTCVC